MTFYLLAVAMFALSVTDCEVCADEMCMSLTLTSGKDQMLICKSNANVDFLFDSTSNACFICYRLRDILSRNVHDLDLDL